MDIFALSLANSYSSGLRRGISIGVSIDLHVRLFAHKARPHNRTMRAPLRIQGAIHLKF
jgi:hypothetical protein